MAAIFGVLGQITDGEVSLMGNRLTHRGKNHTIERIFDRLIFGYGSDENKWGIFKNSRYAIVTDVSIYNRGKLQDYLSNKGQTLRTGSDEEIILALYGLEKLGGIDRINGDFAFAIWDQKNGELTLGRDFLGSHPLYYTLLPGGGLAFASEYKALLGLPEVLPIVDLDMIQYLQIHKRVPADRTPLKNVHPVLPGSIFVFDRNGNHLRQEHLPKLRLSIRYFSEEEASQKVREALYSAIRCRVNDQRNIGVALSGGIDSIGLVSTLRHLYPEAEIHTFTTGDSENDLINASETAQKMNTMHHEILIHPDFLKDSLADLVWCLEEPCGRTETLLLREVGRVASKFVQVMFASAGPDTLFGGMPRHKLLWLMKKAPILKRPLGEFYDLTQVDIKPKSLLERAFDTLYFRGKLPNVPKVIGASYFAKPSEFGQINQEFINTNLVKRFQYGICSGMQKYEKNFAAFGMSYRSPFFDRNLIQVAYSIPDSLKIRNGREKYIFRRALKSIVPDELLNVPKSLQRMSYDLNFSNTLDEISDKFLSRENVIRRGFFDYSDIERLRKRKTDKPYSGEGAMRLWTALLTETWAQEFLDKRGAGPRSSPESQ